jgi:AraC-like DNA-binding protein
MIRVCQSRDWLLSDRVRAPALTNSSGPQQNQWHRRQPWTNLSGRSPPEAVRFAAQVSRAKGLGSSNVKALSSLAKFLAVFDIQEGVVPMSTISTGLRSDDPIAGGLLARVSESDWVRHQYDALGYQVDKRSRTCTERLAWSSTKLGPVNLLRTSAGDLQLICDPKRQMPAERGVVFCISVMVRGSATLLRRVGVDRMNQGDVGIFQANEAHAVTFDGEFDQVHVRVPARHVGDDFRTVANGALLRADSSLARYVRSCVLETARVAPSVAHQELLAHQLIALFRLAWSELSKGSAGKSSSCFDRAGMVIQRELSDVDLSARYVAEQLGVSESYLHRSFRQQNTTPNEVIWNARLSNIRRSLGDPTQSRRTISAIARDWGCQNQAHFSRRFRAKYGMTASECREKSMAAASVR